MKKSEYSVGPAFFSGYFAVIVQCLLVREFLSVFFGNELVLGILFAVWLLFSGIGSFWGNKKSRWHSTIIISLLTGFALSSTYLIRFFPALFAPGSVIPTVAIALLFILAEAPVAFCTGYIFGSLSMLSRKGLRIYLLENAGSLLGALVVLSATMMHATNSIILILAIVPLPLILLIDTTFDPLKKTSVFILLTGLLICSVFIILKTDTVTTAWKYAGRVSNIRQTREGEIASMIHDRDTTILLNNTIYKSTLNKQVAEQAVHIPAAQLKKVQNALVIFDKGYYTELAKYPQCHVDIIETLPEVASSRSIITSPEKYHADTTYNLILLGSPLPHNTGSSRFYTVSFFKRMHSLMAPQSVFSFTLPFNENYMPSDERRLYAILHNTLTSVFTNVLIFPGGGYATFMASDDPLHIPDTIAVPTDYLSSFVLPALFEDRIEKANTFCGNKTLNKNTRPIVLYFSLKNWMKTFGFSATVLWGIGIGVLILSIILLPRTSSILSVGTSGFSTGLYSIGIMLLYQATYGSLYAEIALLLIALSLGFVAGSKMQQFPFSDSLIGVYCISSFLVLSTISQPPVFLFFICHFGIGFLSAGQFVTRKDTALGILNTADLIGGVFGMALSSTLLIPLFGIIPVMAGVFIMKLVVEIITRFCH